MMNATIMNYFAENALFAYPDWHAMSMCGTLDEEFIRSNCNRLNLSLVVRSQRLSTDLLQYLFNILEIAELEFVAQFYPMDEALASLFIERYPLPVVYARISACKPLSVGFLLRHADRLDWRAISYYGVITTEEDLAVFAPYVDWNSICRYFRFSNFGMVLFADRIVWRLVLRTHALSASMIRYMSASNCWAACDWDLACRVQTVPEEVLRLHRADLDWRLVCKYQKLSAEFMSKHAKYLDWTMVSTHQRLTWPFYQVHHSMLVDCANVRASVDRWTRTASLGAKLGFDMWTYLDKFVIDDTAVCA